MRRQSTRLFKNTKLWTDRANRLFIFFLLNVGWASTYAYKIDGTHYRFCVMDNATIADEDAVAAKQAGRLPSIPAYWYGYNGVEINGTEKTLKTDNDVTNVSILMRSTYSGNNPSLMHYWSLGMGGYAQDKYTTFIIKVDAPSGVTFDDAPTHLGIDDEINLNISLLGSFTPFSGSGYFAYEFTTSDPNIIEIVNSSKIVAKGPGSAVITVKAYAKNSQYAGSYYIGSDTIEIEVTENLEPTRITLSEEAVQLFVGETTILTTQLEPEDARTEVSWSSSNEDVATVDGGLIKAMSKGEAIITASTNNNLQVSCVVTVLGDKDNGISEILENEEDDSEIIDLNGLQVKNPNPGIYIKGRKKIMVR